MQLGGWSMWNNWAQAPSWGSLYIIKRPVKPVTGGLPLLCSDVVPLLPLLNDCRCDGGRVCLFTALPLCHCFLFFSTLISTLSMLLGVFNGVPSSPTTLALSHTFSRSCASAASAVHNSKSKHPTNNYQNSTNRVWSV